MGDQDVSTDGREYKSSLKFGQSSPNQEYTQIDDNSLDHNYMNNSLVFGNDSTRTYLDKRGTSFEYENEKNDVNLTYDGEDTTQNDISIRLQNSPIGTPFLDKLKDPFDVTEELSKSETSTPYHYKFNYKSQSDVNKIKITVDQKYQTFSSPSDFRVKHSQEDTTNHKIKYLHKNTQEISLPIAHSQLLKDTQVISNPTQLIGSDTQIIQKDTQLIDPDTQLINGDTQMINQDIQILNKDSQLINGHTQELMKDSERDIKLIFEDTQIINKDNKIIDGNKDDKVQGWNNNFNSNFDDETQRINKDTQTIDNFEDETQRINNNAQTINNELQFLNKHLNYEYETKATPGDSNEDNEYTTETPSQAKIIGSAVQIPSTVEVKGKSHREVINTQEETDSSFIDTSEYSQRQEVNTEEVEVQTDDESNAYVLSSSAEVPYDDSLLNYKLHKRKPSVEYVPTSSPKSSKLLKIDLASYSNDEDSPLEKVKRKDMKGPVIIDSSNEIEESSPLIAKKADLLKIVSKSSPLKNDFNSENSGTVEKHDIPSSPNKLEGKLNKNDNINNNEESNGKNGQLNNKMEPEDREVLNDNEVESLGSLSNNFVLRNEDNVNYSDSIKYPDSVWASFNFKMCTGRITKPGKDFLIVEFEEGAYEIKNINLFLLDIRIGDTVRVKSSRSQYIITGLTCKNTKQCIRCVRGYDTLILKKGGRKNKKVEEICVELDRCYMEISDWVKHQQRMERVNNYEKAENIPSSDILETPKRGSRHYTLANNDIQRPRLGPFSSPVKVNDKLLTEAITMDNKVFSGKLFCITSIDGERKQNLVELILENGGEIIDDRISDVVEFTYSKNGNLSLYAEKYKDFDFFAMISNNSCRSAKYLQALALGWPILSDTFIFNCIKNRNEVKNWFVYLLPAGHSNYLNTIKSLETYHFRKNYENDLKLGDQWGINSSLLDQFKIVIYKPKLNQISVETCKFIFHAFGAKSLIFCDNMKLLRQNIKMSKDEKMIIYDDGVEVRKNLTKNQKNEADIGMANNQMKKLRTRTTRASSKVVVPAKPSHSSNYRTIGLVNWEWVVQCTISTYIWEPDYIEVSLT